MYILFLFIVIISQFKSRFKWNTYCEMTSNSFLQLQCWSRMLRCKDFCTFLSQSWWSSRHDMTEIQICRAFPGLFSCSGSLASRLVPRLLLFSRQGRTNSISCHRVRKCKDDVQMSPCQLSEILSIRKWRLRSKRQRIGGSFLFNRGILGTQSTPALIITIGIISWLSRKDIYIPRKYCEFDAM